MPYIIRMDFNGEIYVGQEELLILEKNLSIQTGPTNNK